MTGGSSFRVRGILVHGFGPVFPKGAKHVSPSVFLPRQPKFLARLLEHLFLDSKILLLEESEIEKVIPGARR